MSRPIRLIRLRARHATGLALASLAALAWPAGPAHAAYPNSFGGNGTDEVRVVRNAPNGDVYLAGHFAGSMEVSVGSTTETLISRGGQDVYVMRMNAAGQVLWARSGGGTDSDDAVNDLALDSANNVYIVGEFFGRASFGPTDLTTVDGNNDDHDGYVVKLTTVGGWEWARRFGSHYNDRATSVVAIPGMTSVPGEAPIPESVVVAGAFRETAYFQGGPTVTGTNAPDASDLMVARITASGAWSWARTRPGTTGNESAERLVVDATPRVWLVGTAAQGSGVRLERDLQTGDDYPSGDFTNPASNEIFISGGAASDPARVALTLVGSPDLNNLERIAETRAMDATGASRIFVSLDVQRGAFSFFTFLPSDDPDFGDDLFVEYFAGGIWRNLNTYPGHVGGRGEIFSRQGALAYVITDPAAMNSSFKLRMRHRRLGPFFQDYYSFFGLFVLPVPYPDTWHLTNLKVEVRGTPRPFVMSLGNVRSTDPQFNAPTPLPEQFDIADAAISTNGSRLLLTGTRLGSMSMAPCGAVGGTGAAVMSLDISGGSAQCLALAGLAGADSSGIATDTAGNVYIAGNFSGAQFFMAGADGTLTSNGGRDPFIGSLDSNLNWRWVTGGDRFDTVDGIPARGGGTGDDAALTISTGGPSSKLYVGGRFTREATFGEADRVEATGGLGVDGYIATLGRDGRYPREERWIAGMDVMPPPGARTDSLTHIPEFKIGGVMADAIGMKLFTWLGPVGAGGRARLVALQPGGSIEVLWRVAGEDLQSSNRISSFGQVVYPSQPCSATVLTACYQVHTVGAPVAVEPPSGAYRIQEVIPPSSNSSVPNYSGGRFTASRSGYAVLVYINGPTIDPLNYPTVVEIVRTLPYEALPQFVDNVPVEIGKKIVDAYHDEPGRTGFVVNELAYYDGQGEDAAYNRAARTGAIIPVNRYNSNRALDQGRELAVAWFRANSKGVYWPDKAVRYQPYWPIDPPRIIIASEQGSEVLGQTRLAPAQFASLNLYIQNDKDLPGYNPNDEHAFMAPSSLGSGLEAAFALRADFGNRQAGDVSAASDPYVLLRYFDPAAQERRFLVYSVQATGAGFNQFRYTGTAGTTISPPYPLRLLAGCPETLAVGQASNGPPPPPFFKDYKNQLWAKSAGSGAIKFFYPPQPGFFTDLDNNQLNDLVPDRCVPWLARLPASLGGTDPLNDPITVSYEIAWPDNAPLLIAGETLLTPKRGLPDIYNQAAVEVVYDAIQDEVANAPPGDTVAQLLDPTNPRFVRLDKIPTTVAQELQTNGTVQVTGSSDGTIKLAISIRDRLSYDPINKRLILQGEFDETGAGEPFLLLNVLSKRDRIALKKLDGGDGNEEGGYTGSCAALGCTWDQSVEALFRKSRNPQGITKICDRSTINASNVRVCAVSTRAVGVDDVLIGYQDNGNDGILEPFQAVGVGPALSAGLSKGNGYLTLAFNNNASLTPLPVSLQVIQVGCLAGPSLPPTPYQGQLNVIAPEDVFDEQLVLRHSGDFGGNPDALEFEWYYHPDSDGTPPMPLPQPETGQLNGWFKLATGGAQGAVEISIAGANLQTLSDNWFVARYRGLGASCDNVSKWSLYAGQPGATPINQRAQLAQGWVKRVLGRLNPFEARVQNFGAAETNNFSSMLIQLGERYAGPIALNNDPGNLNSIGLIEAYTTVMLRALSLSADATPPIDYGPANNAILLVASRLVDFYTLLGNEAYADAQDPTVAITTAAGTFSLAPTIFNFQNQLDSLLSEELVLLRGRDDANGPVAATPVYNRLFWNFTTGDGEVAYALSYDISDQNFNGVIDEFDARIMYPQGHGDAWGHYLTGTKIYYTLLRHPFFSWVPRPEAVAVAGVPLQVDFLDERQFAETAAAKARTGAEIVDLTYRNSFVADPEGQWQGYDDVQPERAWGLSEWGRRAGMGAYFDWVTVNAIVPEKDPNPAHVGIQKIERATVSHLDEIASHYTRIQGQVDEADAGLNPLGLAQNVVPFDIDPSLLDRFNVTQFEQVYARALEAVKNAVNVWDYANELGNQLRRTQDNADELYEHSIEEETDFVNQLIEIFGYPYADDIGPGGTYPAGYDGPDLYHYMYIDVPQLAGSQFDFDSGGGQPFGVNRPDDVGEADFGIARIKKLTAVYAQIGNGVGHFGMTPVAPGTVRTGATGQVCSQQPLSDGCALGGVSETQALEVQYTQIQSPDFGTWFTKPAEWTTQRRAPGKLQQILQQMLEARVALKQALIAYDTLRLDIQGQVETLQATFNTSSSNLAVANRQRDSLRNLTIATETMKGTAVVARRVGEVLNNSFGTASKCVPDSLIFGLAGGGDILSTAKCAISGAGGIVKFSLDTAADVLDIASSATDAAKEDVEQLASIDTLINDARLANYTLQGDIDQKFREEPQLRAEIYARTEAIKQLLGDYNATLAEGLRVADRLVVFRKDGAEDIQLYRFRDMAFRIFRNDALQKYRASFDLAARYVYLAAAAYDYETNLLGSDAQGGQGFLTSIVRERNLGQILNGTPLPGSPGLADSLAQLKLNFDVLKGQMGFNNPQVETNRFSLRRELFRIPEGADGDAAWRAKLEASRVPDLWRVPEFRRFARPFAPESAGPQPGLVLEFTTNVTFGLNFFGWDLGPQDSSYDSSQFATRIRSVGTWFADYADLPLADDPRIYLFPVGADVLRSPSGDDFETREWQVVEQAIPVPFPLGSGDLQDYAWNASDTLGESSTAIRRYARFPAYHFSEPFNDAQVVSDSRLVGRSVWNRRWLLIIPGGTFLNDPDEGLDTFINGRRIPGDASARDGDGVDDIRVFFKTYAYSGQ